MLIYDKARHLKVSCSKTYITTLFYIKKKLYGQKARRDRKSWIMGGSNYNTNSKGHFRKIKNLL